MFSSKCDKCGQYMTINYILTLCLFSSKLPLLINEDGTKTIDSLPDTVVLTCPYCRHISQSTFSELIDEFKFEMMETLLKQRESDSRKMLDKTKLKEENGVSFCGMCGGPLGDGYCYNDLKLQCIVRNKLLKQLDNNA